MFYLMKGREFSLFVKMDVQPSWYIMVLFLILTRITSLIFLVIIYKYLNRKTPVMKTIFDFMIQDLIVSGLACGTFTDFASTGFGPLGPISISSAILIVMFQLLAVHYWFMQIFFTFLARYLCIFHFHLIDNVEDNLIVFFTRSTCLTWAIFSVIYETYREDFLTNDYVQNMAYDNPDSLEKEYHSSVTATKMVVILNIVFIAFVFVRIEMYKWQFPSSPYSKSTMRMTLALFVILILSLIVRLFFPLSFRDMALMYHLVFTFIIFVFIPGLMFFRNEKLVNYAGYLLNWKGNRVDPLDQ